MRRTVCGLLSAMLCWSCGASDRSPVAPGPPSSPALVRGLHLEGPITFGDVTLGQSADRELRITNTGNQVLTVVGLTFPADGIYSSVFTGTIAPQETVGVPIRFTPAAMRTYRGWVTVQADHTAGSNTAPISGRGLSTTPVPRGQRVFLFDSSPQPRGVSEFTEASRYVLHDDGTFALQFPNWEYRGRYTEADGRIVFEWNDSGPGPYQWIATGVLAGEALTVTYNEWMGWADFENGVYIRIP